MRQRFVSSQSEKAWLFHRSKWSTINDPLFGEELPIFRASGPRRQTLRRFFCGYQLTMWMLGPTFLRPVYSGSLVYVYVHEETRKARYLILIEAVHASEIVYAQDLPDTIELLHLLAPIIETDILVDIYRRGINTFSRS
jgi:hypothetical protein